MPWNSVPSARKRPPKRARLVLSPTPHRTAGSSIEPWWWICRQRSPTSTNSRLVRIFRSSDTSPATNAPCSLPTARKVSPKRWIVSSWKRSRAQAAASAMRSNGNRMRTIVPSAGAL